MESHARLSMLRLFALLFAASQPSVLTESQHCLDPSLRTGIVSHTEWPVDIWINDWPSCHLVSAIFRILAEEVLGYNTTITFGIATWQALRALAGCPNPTDKSTSCDSAQYSRHHVALELWDARIYPFGDPNAKPYLGDLGGIGYVGQQGMVVLEQHLFHQDRWYDFYRSYYTELKPWVIFEKISNLTAFDMKPCGQTRLYNNRFIEDYLRYSGDSDGVVGGADGVVAKCWNELGQVTQTGTWWLAPTCRFKPEHCIPLITCGDGWQVEEYLQKAAGFNMPLAISVAENCSQIQEAWLNTRILFGFYTPQAFNLRTIFVKFPLHDAFEWTQGKRLTQSSSTVLSKYVTTGFGILAGKATQMLQRFQITYATISDLLVRYPVPAPDDIALRYKAAESMACDWLRSNPSTWRTWIPEATECSVGQGLVDVDGMYLTEDISTRYACKTCMPGTVSVFAGTTSDRTLVFLCRPCLPGSFQPNPGSINRDADVSCPECVVGRYSSDERSAYCTPCEIGKYQNETGKTSCSACPGGTYNPLYEASGCIECEQGTFIEQAGLHIFCESCAVASYQSLRGQTGCVHCRDGFTTSMQGASRESECMCPTGWYYDVGRHICEACPETTGISCPGGHLQVNMTQDETVRIIDNYMALPDTLDVYYCKDTNRCVGLRSPFSEVDSPPMCSGGFVAPGCSACAEGEYEDNNKCSSCEELFWPVGILVMVLYLVVLNACAGFYYATMFPPSPFGTSIGPIIGLMQSLSMAAQIQIRWQKEMLTLLESFNFIMGELSDFGFPSGCVWGNSPSLMYASRILWPFSLLLSFMFLYYSGNFIPAVVCRIVKRDVASPVEFLPRKGFLRRLFTHSETASKMSDSKIPLSTRVQWFWRPKFDNVFNCILKTSNALYISFVNTGLCLLIFKKHPSGQMTLTTYPRVSKFDSEWYALLPSALVALLVYCLSVLAYVLYVVSIAPRRFPVDPRFRVRHRGLWAKYTPTTWWFCITSLAYALALNLSVVLFITGRGQLVSCIFSTILYIWFITHARPFKFTITYLADMFCKSGYLFFSVIAITTIEDPPFDMAKAQVFMLISGFLPIVVCIFLVARYFWYREIATRTALEKRVAFVYRLMDITSIMGSIDRFDIRAFGFQLLDTDVEIVDQALDVMSYTLVGLQPPKLWKRYCGTKPFEPTLPGRLEGEVLDREIEALHGEDRLLFRRFRDSLLNVERHESMHSVKHHHIRGLSRVDHVEEISNKFFYGSLVEAKEFSLAEFKNRMAEIYTDGAPLSEAELEQLFAGLALEDRARSSSEPTVNRNELCVQLSYHTDPIFSQTTKNKSYDSVTHTVTQTETVSETLAETSI